MSLPPPAEELTVRAPSRAIRVHAASLVVTSGVDQGVSSPVNRPVFVVGTGDDADLKLTDETVSHEHMRVSLEPNGVRVRDGGSRNGTWLGTLRIHDVVLRNTADLTLGTTTLRLVVEADPVDLPVSSETRFGGALGESVAMRHLFALLERAATTDVTLLLEGESGVGKDVLARALHAASRRAERPFVAIDCGAIPAGLLESELFGHERGAFTGAVAAHMGAFEQANGGTLFLDEIGELSLDLQPKLLRALETRDIRPVGSRTTRPVDVRIVSATSRRLAEAARSGEFRQDLFYRLAVARVVVPPLRDRPEDIATLATHFLRLAANDPAATLAPDLETMLRTYSWPGNVRELRNVIDRHVLLGLSDRNRLFDVEHVRSAATSLASLPYHEARRQAVDAFERVYVPEIMKRADGVVTQASKLAEVARPTFYRMLERLRIPTGEEEP